MNRSIMYFVVFLIFVSCQSVDQASMPKTLIEEDQMVEILTDIAFLKAAKTSNKATFEAEKINPESFILKKYSVDSIVFAENNAWYSGQIDKYQAIFVRVKANLDKEKTKYEKLKKKKDSVLKAKRDSIKKLGDTLKVKKDKITPVPEFEEVKEDIKNAKDKRINALSPSKKG
ncbi:DUF4296 domain-containing protein [Aquimarina sediminis]|uniref:DUF4296 domain-containing protein n=1 Tax=Aquimarina sediminis TaxID=2070536 RepID=UPI000CA01ACA|nr:DUF4296 domain-containing protein [Aquimarina sediminis]